MRSTSFFVLVLSAFSSALPSTLVRKDGCTPKVTYTISRFTIFIPDAGNPNPHSVCFDFSDDANTSIYAQCQLSGPVDPTVALPCTNPNITALLNGSTLTITETYTPCNSTGTANITGVLNINTFCTPTEPPLPMGYGEECQVLPQGQLTGRWST